MSKKNLRRLAGAALLAGVLVLPVFAQTAAAAPATNNTSNAATSDELGKEQMPPQTLGSSATRVGISYTVDNIYRTLQGYVIRYHGQNGGRDYFYLPSLWLSGNDKRPGLASLVRYSTAAVPYLFVVYRYDPKSNTREFESIKVHIPSNADTEYVLDYTALTPAVQSGIDLGQFDNPNQQLK